MGKDTKISWAHHTFNPWIGCSAVSTGCRFCYAETFSEKKLKIRWGNHPRHITAPSTWAQPISWNRKAHFENTRYRVFCASLADVFEDNPELIEPRKRLWELILQTPYLDWLLLTKRPQNYEMMFPEEWKASGYMPRNIWLGATVCNQNEYNINWPILRDFQKKYDVTISFISYEPLLARITPDKGSPDWSLIGGESGFLKNARPMSLEWVKNLMDGIRVMNDPALKIFFKQVGTQQAKMLKMADPKGEQGIENLPKGFDWLKIREIPFET